jgi:invasion protein IalB
MYNYITFFIIMHGYILESKLKSKTCFILLMPLMLIVNDVEKPMTWLAIAGHKLGKAYYLTCNRSQCTTLIMILSVYHPIVVFFSLIT